MNNQKVNYSQSWLTAEPKDALLRKKFKQFRLDDIAEMYKVAVLIKLLHWLTFGFAAVKKTTPQAVEIFVLQTPLLILRLVVLGIGHRFKKQLIWMIPCLFVIESMLIILISVTIDDAEYMGVNAIMNENYFSQIQDAGSIFIAFLCPSVGFLIYYQVAFFGMLALSALAKGHDSEALKTDFDLERHTWNVGVVMIFYLLHLRELKRFFEQ